MAPITGQGVHGAHESVALDLNYNFVFGETLMDLKQMSMKDLHGKIAQLHSAEVILDVRAAIEYLAGHVKGSLNIPHDQINAHLDQLRPYKKIYIHCRSGKRAQMAAETLLKAGFNNLVCVTGSGMDDWLSAGFPVEKGNT